MSAIANQRVHRNGRPGHSGAMTIVRKRVASLKPSPENLALYRCVEDDPDIDALADSIRKYGLQEPLIITRDRYVVSGHRRLEALVRNGQKFVACKVLPIRRTDMSRSKFVALLREHNRQRNKSVAEQVRETIVDIDPILAAFNLAKRQNRSVYADSFNDVTPLKLEGKSHRYRIKEEKAEHVRLILQIVQELAPYWPLSVRGVHYPLLNHAFLRNAKEGIPYANDRNSYRATSDLITRLRFLGEIPWRAFDDKTRPFDEFHPFANVREFIQHEGENLFGGYWRDLLQTQPNHIECVVEKNTVRSMALQVTRKYQITTSSLRGFSDVGSWHKLAQRYWNSGKERLIVIALSDYDPEGELIPVVGGRTLRDEFGVNVDVIKAGVTREQIDKYKLPPQNFAKEKSSNRKWFIERTGGETTYELEALRPADMLHGLETVIKSVIDLDLYNREAEKEHEEAVYLEAARQTAAEALKGLWE